MFWRSLSRIVEHVIVYLENDNTLSFAISYVAALKEKKLYEYIVLVVFIVILVLKFQTHCIENDDN